MAHDEEILHETVLEEEVPAPSAFASTRRGFLRGITGLGLAGLGVAILGKVSTATTFLGLRPAMAEAKGYLVLDPALCTGCRTCMVAC